MPETDDILLLARSGHHSNAEIARKLDVHRRTVDRIIRRAGVDGSVAAARRKINARENGLRAARRLTRLWDDPANRRNASDRMKLKARNMSLRERQALSRSISASKRAFWRDPIKAGRAKEAMSVSAADRIEREAASMSLKMGKCKWRQFITTSGGAILCQGTWELAFAKWADDHGLILERGKQIAYLDHEGLSKRYVPDFLVSPWGIYVEIKGDHLLDRDLKKVALVRKANPSVVIEVLSSKELLALDIKLPNFSPQITVDKPQITNDSR